MHLLGSQRRIFDHVIIFIIKSRCHATSFSGRPGIHILPTHSHWRTQTVSGLEFSRFRIDSGNRYRWPNPVHILIDVRTFSGSKIFLFVHHKKPRVDKVRPILHCRFIGFHEQLNFLGNGDIKGIFLDGRFPVNFTMTLYRR